MRPLEESLGKLLETIREKSDAFEQELNALPNQKPCDRHPAQVAVLLVDKSWEAKKPVYGCPECADDIRARRRVRKMDAAGIPFDVRHATTANFDVKRMNVAAGKHTPEQFREAAMKFQDGDSRNLLMCGTPGIGKGHLAAALAITELDSGGAVAWIDCAGLFSAYHAAYSSGTTAVIVEHHTTADLLVLDEICLRDLPADGEEILFAILDRRHKTERRTIMLSNKTGKDIRAWLGGRIYDRLKSGGVSYCYGEWDSMRGTAGDGSGDEF